MFASVCLVAVSLISFSDIAFCQMPDIPVPSSIPGIPHVSKMLESQASFDDPPMHSRVVRQVSFDDPPMPSIQKRFQDVLGKWNSMHGGSIARNVRQMSSQEEPQHIPK